MRVKIATLVACANEAAAAKPSEAVPGQVFSGWDVQLTAHWTHGPETASGLITLFDEVQRASIARQYHLAMIDGMTEWKQLPTGHRHPQLTSEPDD